MWRERRDKSGVVNQFNFSDNCSNQLFKRNANFLYKKRKYVAGLLLKNCRHIMMRKVFSKLKFGTRFQ